jgi:hypothetical protein
VIRITIQQKASPTVVIIDGRMASADLAEVQRVRQSLPGLVALDLGGLDACADEGIELLRAWLNSGAQLMHAAPFLRMVLEGAQGQVPWKQT